MQTKKCLKVTWDVFTDKKKRLKVTWDVLGFKNTELYTDGVNAIYNQYVIIWLEKNQRQI